MKAFTVMGRTFKGAYEEFFLVVGLSVLFWIGTLLVVTAPMTWAGMHHVANRMANYKRVEFGFFWEGARQHIGRGVWLVGYGGLVLRIRRLCATAGGRAGGRY